jgi:uncharacterized repeat protein (TIGR03806 family)
MPRRFSSILAASLCVAVFNYPANAALTQRWSFNSAAGSVVSGTTLADSVSGTSAVVRGLGASFDSSALVLPGTTTGNVTPATISAYLDLPNGILSSRENVSIELWATPVASSNFQRIFDFGASSAGDGLGAAGEWTGLGATAPNNVTASDEFGLTFNVGNSINAQRLYGRLNYDQVGALNLYVDSALATTLNQRYHYVVTYAKGVGTYGASGGGRESWYRDGTLVATLDLPYALSAINDVNNWIGRSQFSADQLSRMNIDELRLYDHALTSTEVAANRDGGPDVLVTPPDPVVPPVPDHLWVFNAQADSTVDFGLAFIDSVGGMVATLRGNGASLTGTALRLPGTTDGNQTAGAISAYLDLPNGIISARSAITFEAWAAPRSSKNWQRLFEFGRCATTHGEGAAPGEILDIASAPGATAGYDNLGLTLNTGTNLNSQQLEGQYDGNAPVYSSTTAATTAGTEYHYVFVIEDGVGTYGATGCRARWYRNGALQNSMDFPFLAGEMEDVNNWIGRSLYTGDSNSNLDLNELRIYNRAITPAEVLASYEAGADPTSGPPEPLPPAPLPVNRWSFNDAAAAAASGTAFLDTSGRETITVRGNGATLNGTAIVLPGTTNGNQTAAAISAYLDLRNGLVSGLPSLTLEAWVTPLSSKNWQRLFDFGNCSITSGTAAAAGEIVDGATAPGGFVANDNLFLSLNVNNTLGSHRLAAKVDGGTETGLNTDLSSVTVAGTEYHYVLTVEDQAGVYGASGCRVRWYRNGEQQGSVDLAYRLTDLSDVNNWIGRSNWAADTNANIALNEFRLYDRAISLTEVISSYQAGSAAAFAAPVANADAATIHAGQKVLLDVLANDTGAPIPDTLQILAAPSTGTAVLRDGKILYTHGGSASAPVTFTYRVSNVSGVSATGQVTISFATGLRLDNPAIAMPSAPPPTFYQVADAIPGVSFSEPIGIATQPGSTRRVYVCERMAKIQLVPDITAAAPAKALFLDLAQVVAGRTPAESIVNGANYEFGLLGLAFHPQYSTNGYFYVAYSVRINGVDYERVSRFRVSSGNPDAGDPASELILLQQLDEGANHNGGDLHFGPDGYLYYAAGDEENPNDFRANSQRLDKDFFAGIFRLDVDKRAGNLEPTAHAAIPTDGGVARFSVPVDNPFVPVAQGGSWNGAFTGLAVTDMAKLRMEYWAVGLRHPWRMSFDALNGDLWAGDVGQNLYEEVNRIVKGGNYGWVWREGFTDTTFATNPTKPANFASTDPVWAYPHTSVAGADPQFAGNSVVGGIVYRGTRFPALYGQYVFCDSVSGHIWKLDPATKSVSRLTGVPGVYGGLVSMGVDPSNQDLLFADYLNSRIIRLVTGTSTSSFPGTLSETGLFADLADLSPSPGLLPYQVNLAFWSDYAIKRRWFALPDASKFTPQRDANWTYPTGLVLVKHFDMEMTRGDAATRRRLETRVLVKGDAGFYGVSYRWNDEQTEATLVPDEGVEFDLSINDGGVLRTQRWGIPSRSSCLTCHTPQSGGALSFNTRQLNRDGSIHGYMGNQLSTLENAGYFSASPGDPAALPRHLRPDETLYSVEARARSYVAVNCSYCHRADGTVAGSSWDGRPELTLVQTSLINGVAENNGGNPANRYIVPGDLAHSIVYNRVAVQNGFTRMPPLASNELDQSAIALLTEWIAALGARADYPAWRLATFGSANSPEGAEAADADGDGQDNLAEFISFTDPLDPSSALRTSITNTGAGGGATLTVSFVLPPDRAWTLETSTNLTTWSAWAPAGADGVPRATATIISLTAPAPDSAAPRRFFRLRLSVP